MDDADSAKWNAVYKAVEVALDIIESTSPGVFEDHPNRITDLITRMIEVRSHALV